jgi:hypothetical protein
MQWVMTPLLLIWRAVKQSDVWRRGDLKKVPKITSCGFRRATRRRLYRWEGGLTCIGSDPVRCPDRMSCCEGGDPFVSPL